MFLKFVSVAFGLLLVSVHSSSNNSSYNDSSSSSVNYIYVDASAICEDSVNMTINYTCDGSMDYPYSNIKDGLAASNDETILTLFDGTYTGDNNINLEIYDKYRRITSYNNNNPSNTIIDCDFNGFGIAFNKGTFFLSGITIENCIGIERQLFNLSLGNGTAVPSIENSTIGGAIWVENGYLNIDNCIFRNNYAQLGGALYGYSVSVEISNSTFNENSAKKGGAIYLWNGYVELNESTVVIDNEAANGGGGVYIKKATIELDYGSYLNNNEADNNLGNEVYCASGAGTLLHSSYISTNGDIDSSDFEYGDAICTGNCALTQESVNFDYCNYSPPTTTENENDDDDSDNGDTDTDGTNSGSGSGGGINSSDAYNNKANVKSSLLLSVILCLCIVTIFG